MKFLKGDMVRLTNKGQNNLRFLNPIKDKVIMVVDVTIDIGTDYGLLKFKELPLGAYNWRFELVARHRLARLFYS